MAQLTTRHEHMQAIAKKFKPVDYELADMWPASKPGCSETFHDANLGVQVRVSEYVKNRSSLSDGPNFGLFTTKARPSNYEIISQYVGDRCPAKWMDIHSDYTFEVVHKAKKFVIDARDPAVSSAARYVNCGSIFSRNNCVFYNNKGNIYLVRVKPMQADEEFLAPYEKEDDIERWSLRLEQEIVHLVDDSVKQEVLTVITDVRGRYTAEIQNSKEALEKSLKASQSYKQESEKKIRTLEEAWRQRMTNLEAKVKAVEAHIAGQKSHPPQHAPLVQLSHAPFTQPAYRPPPLPVQTQTDNRYGTQRLRPGTTHTYRSSVRSRSPQRTPYDRHRSEQRPNTSHHSTAGEDRRHSVSSSSIAPYHRARSVTTDSRQKGSLSAAENQSTDTRQSAALPAVDVKGEGQRRFFSELPPPGLREILK